MKKRAAKRKAYGTLIRRIREFIKAHEGRYSQSDLLHDAYDHGDINDIKTIASAEKHHSLSWDTFVSLASALSARLKTIRVRYPNSQMFDLLKDPEFAWLLDRLVHEIDPTLKPEHLIMNHESRYLIDDFHQSLTVWPCPESVVALPRSGRSAESFSYSNLAESRTTIRFSEDNQKLEKGFKLKYGSTDGRIELLEPGSDRLTDDSAYRLHKTSATYLPDPLEGSTHRFGVKIYNGFGPGGETTHSSLAQAAIYRNVSYSLDLTAYPEAAILMPPELIMVPVLTDRPFDCCEIASQNCGLKVAPDERDGLKFKWNFRDLINVMLCVRWQSDPDFVVAS